MAEKQRDEDWLRAADLDEIRAAYERGELADLFGADPAQHDQIDEETLAAMTPEAIVAAQAAGKLNYLLGGPVPIPESGQLEAHHLKGMSPEQIVTAQEAGRFDGLLGAGNVA